MTISSFDPAAGRNILTPFRINAKQGHRCIEVICTNVLRVLPAKRLVCSGTCGGDQVVVKIFLNRKRAEKHCLWEQKGLLALKKAGIAAPKILFQGHLDPGGSPVIMLEKIDPAVGLDKAWVEARSLKQRAELLQHVIEVIADQHASGFWHDDMHMGNFLFSGKTLYTIDGGAVCTRKTGHPLSPKKSVENLALFFAQIYPEFDSLIPDAFRVYVLKRQWQQADKINNLLFRQIHLRRRLREKAYLKKIYRESSSHVCRKNRHEFLLCDRRLYTEKMAGFLKNPDAFFDENNLLKNGNSSTVALVRVDGRSLVVKRYNIKNAWHAFARAFRPSRAWVCWRNAHRLILLGIATPAPVAVLEKRFGPLRSGAYYITEHVSGTNMQELLCSGGKVAESQEMTARLFKQFLQTLANASAAHGDLKASNFLLSDEKLVVMDLDAMRKYQNRLSLKRKLKKDCRRLLKNWQDKPEIYKRFSRQLEKLHI